MSYTPNFFTRRQQIHFEIHKDYIKLAVIAVLLIAALVVGIGSCNARNRAAQSDDGSVSETDIHGLYTARERIQVSTYPRLVSAANPLGADYVPPELTRLYGMPDGVNIQLNFDAATAFTKLYNAMLEDGLGLIPLSGYRTYQEQVAIFNYNLELHISEGMTVEEAQKYTEMYVAVPGTSEHQYGRSIDVTIDGTTDHDFHHTEQGKWLIEHCHEYGFIIRYPEDKVDITGIAYEPWHLRYVGIEHATYMYENDLCLEEYLTYVRTDCPYASCETD